MKRLMLLAAVLLPLSAVALAAESQPSSPSTATTPSVETLTADTPRTTVEGNHFHAPAGWSIRTEGPAVFLMTPESGSRIALVDVRAPDADAAVAAAWATLKPAPKWPIKLASDIPPRDGWEQIRYYAYETSANDKLLVVARAYRRGAVWTVIVGEVPWAIADKRGAQFVLLTDRILPKDQERESFAGKKAHALTPERLDALHQFVGKAQKQLDIPGVALGMLQDGKVVYAGGLGVRALGKPDPVDADTLFLIASNTKPMTTLMLAKLVDEKTLGWDMPVSQLWPGFKLGDADTTRKVQVKHLVCACTGLPRQDLEWLMQFEGVTPADAMRGLAAIQPTSEFGALYQYSNQLAAAGGFLGGHVLYPGRELGTAYDEAMRSLVFEPLGMNATTFDFARALAGNHAQPYAPDVDGKLASVEMGLNYSIVPVRPAGGAWSNVRDMLRFVQMELDKGLLSDGTRYISEQALLARRQQQVKFGSDGGYGMGLFVESEFGVSTVGHGGVMIGYQTDMLWLPEHDVGFVVLTNSDSGIALMPLLRRYLLELLFDGKPLAEADLVATASRIKARIAVERKRLTLPAAPEVTDTLASRYRNAALGEVAVLRENGTTVFDFGEWRSEVASRRNDDGSVSLVTVAPGAAGYELVVADAAGKRGLVIRLDQHEYVFDEVVRGARAATAGGRDGGSTRAARAH